LILIIIREKKKMKSDKISKGKENEQVPNFSFDGEEVENVSYFQLFRYATTKDKLMIIVAIFCALIQGATLPLMYAL